MEMTIILKNEKAIKIGGRIIKPNTDYSCNEENGRCIITLEDGKVNISENNRHKFFFIKNECISCGKSFIADVYSMTCEECNKKSAEDYSKTFDSKDVMDTAQNVMGEYTEALNAAANSNK